MSDDWRLGWYLEKEPALKDRVKNTDGYTPDFIAHINSHLPGPLMEYCDFCRVIIKEKERLAYALEDAKSNFDRDLARVRESVAEVLKEGECRKAS